MSLELKKKAYEDYIISHKQGVVDAYYKIKETCADMEFISDEKLSARLINCISNHDNSKHDFEEFDAYRQHWYPMDGEEVDEVEYQKAWIHHYLSNPHHWEYWLENDVEDHEFELLSTVEMVCDWMSVGSSCGNTAKEFYEQNKEKIRISDWKRTLITEIFKRVYPQRNYERGDKMGLIKDNLNEKLNLLVQKLFAGNRFLDRAINQLDLKFVMNKTATALHAPIAHKYPLLADQISEYQGDRNMGTKYLVTPEDSTEYNSPKDIFQKYVDYQVELERVIYDALDTSVDENDWSTTAFLQKFLNEITPYTKQALLLNDKANLYANNWMQFDHNVEDFIVL